jgi:hypothetical protein
MRFAQKAQICTIHQLKFQSQPAVIRISAIPAAPEDLLMPVASNSCKSGSEPPKGSVDTGKKHPVCCQRQRRHGSGIFRCIPFRRPVSARSLANSVSGVLSKYQYTYSYYKDINHSRIAILRLTMCIWIASRHRNDSIPLVRFQP